MLANMEYEDAAQMGEKYKNFECFLPRQKNISSSEIDSYFVFAMVQNNRTFFVPIYTGLSCLH